MSKDELRQEVRVRAVKHGCYPLFTNLGVEDWFALDDQWHHIAVVVENKMLEVYLDGQPARLVDVGSRGRTWANRLVLVGA